MNRILVICTDNACRSPMAEALIQKIAQENGIEDLSVESAGLSAYDEEAPSDYAVETLREIGLDIKDHRSRRVMREDLLDADCIYVMTQQHKDVIVEQVPEVEKKITVMGISDPFGQDIGRYRECRDEMLRYFQKELVGE